MSSRIIIFTFLFISLIKAFSEEYSPKDLLSKAEALISEANTVYWTSEEKKENSTVLTRYYMKKAPDGQVSYLINTQDSNKKGNPRSTLTNSTGTYFIVNKTAIMMHNPQLADNSASDSISNNSEQIIANYSLEEREVFGANFNIVTKTFDTAYYDSLVNDLLNIKSSLSKDKAKSILEKTFPYKTLSYISKKDGLVYRTENFLKSGKLVSTLYYKSIQINIPLDDSIFKIPKDYKIIKSKSSKDFSEILLNSISK